MKIGLLEFKHGIFLAPMAGITDSAFRRICVLFGAECVCSELISAKAVVYGDKKTEVYASLYDDERPAAIQIFGNEPQIMAKAAYLLLREKPAFIDINMGCPVPKLCKNGEGSALMRSPALCFDIVKAVKDAVNVPVTVKIRKGFYDDNHNAPEIAEICEQAGADAIFVHGRTRSEMYSGKADRSIIKEVKRAVSIPVVGNGDIDCPKSAFDMFEVTGCDGIMVGRGAYGNPWLFSELVCAFENKPFTSLPNSEKKAAVLKQAEMFVQERGERSIAELRKHLFMYSKGVYGSASLRARLNTVSSVDELKAALDIIFA